MSTEVFNRYETKYRLDEGKVLWLLEKIEKHMLPDVHNQNGEPYTICNTYYDTADDELIRRSLEKPAYKEKLRVRSYHVPSLKDSVFVEVKKKYKGMVNKRRTAMTLCEAYDFLAGRGRPPGQDGNGQVLQELAYFRDFYEPVPKVCICYDRLAFFDREDKDFRLTFDTRIRTRRERPGLEAGDWGELLLLEGKWLMEVKLLQGAPLWFVRLMSEAELYPAAFSKYGTEYRNYLMQKEIREKKGKQICLNPFLQQRQRTTFRLAQHC